MNRPDFITKNDWKLLTSKYKNMDRIIKKLEKDYPVQYLIGNVDFYGYEVIVNKNVLIPRFETEILLEKTIDYLKHYKMTKAEVLEIGTGSGCIPIVLKSKLPKLKITSIDKSGKALRVAKKNIRKHKLDITLIKADMYKYNPNKKFDVIISNPPYIAYDEEIDPKTKYEPKIALYANDNGLEYYLYILKNTKKMLNDKYILAFEIGQNQGRLLRRIASYYNRHAKIIIEKDLAGKDRYLFVINV